MVGSEDTGMGMGDTISMPGTRDPRGPRLHCREPSLFPPGGGGVFTQIKKDFNFCFISTELF